MGLSEPERVWCREERDLSPEEKEARAGVYLAPSGLPKGCWGLREVMAGF